MLTFLFSLYTHLAHDLLLHDQNQNKFETEHKIEF